MELAALTGLFSVRFSDWLVVAYYLDQPVLISVIYQDY